MNKILPQTQGIGVKFPSLDHQNLGKFTSEFKEIEDLLRRAANQSENSKVRKNIDFLKNQGVIPEVLAKQLHEIREVRNGFTHSSSKVPDVNHLRLLRKCKQEVEAVLKNKN